MYILTVSRKAGTNFANMKRQITKILIITLLFGCNSIDYKPKYKDFANAWERENLIGKVKKIEQYKAIVTNFKTEKTDYPIIEFKKEFSETGNILYQEDFDNFGKLEQCLKNRYDKNGYRTESVSENFVIPAKSIEKVIFDTLIGKQLSAHVISNDTLKLEVFFKYDKNKNLIEHTSIQNGNTTSGRFEYKLDGEERILFKKQIDEGEFGINETINEFHYDAEGNLLELVSKSEFGEMKSTYEYDSEKRIKKITEYQSGLIDKETLFDKFYNKTLVRIYKSNEFNQEMKFEYEFDKKGNWIQRDVFKKEHSEDNKTILVYKEIRKIEYYE